MRTVRPDSSSSTCSPRGTPSTVAPEGPRRRPPTRIAVVEHRLLGNTGFDVSCVALGSWRTFERISRADGIAVMREARDRGIAFLDDARYDDETGSAPIATGYSEVVFGELFRAAGWRRDDTIVSNKLWWEFWPEQSAAEELDASLTRMGFDYLDVAYSERLPGGLPLEEAVSAIAALVAAGKVRAWGVLNWEPEKVTRAAAFARREGLPPIVAWQLPYNVVLRAPVEAPATADALAASGASVVASAVLAGGVLSGKYDRDPSVGRFAGALDSPSLAPSQTAARALAALAQALDTPPAALAIAFALRNASVASVLFGATTPTQVAENCEAVELFMRLSPDDLARVDWLR